MTEICGNCPIKSTDPDAAALCAAASELSNANNPFGNDWINNDELSLEEYYGSDDPYIADLAQQALDFPPEKIAKAKLCAQQILWKTCEFENLA